MLKVYEKYENLDFWGKICNKIGSKLHCQLVYLFSSRGRRWLEASGQARFVQAASFGVL